jgi:hypothetical protein
MASCAVAVITWHGQSGGGSVIVLQQTAQTLTTLDFAAAVADHLVGVNQFIV